MKVLQIIVELLIVAACINAGLAAPVPSTQPRQTFQPRLFSDESGESHRRAFITKEAAHVDRRAETRAGVANVKEHLKLKDHSFRIADVGQLLPRFRPRHSAGQLHPPKPRNSLATLFSSDHILSRREEEIDARFGSIFGYGPITLCRKSLWTLFWRRSKHKTEEEEAEEEAHDKCLIHLPLFGEPKKSSHHPDKRGRKSDDDPKSSTSSTSSNSTHLAVHPTKSPHHPDKRGQMSDDDRKSPTSSTKPNGAHLAPRPRSSLRRRALTTTERLPQDRTQVSTEASAVFSSDAASFALWLAHFGWIALPDALEQTPIELFGADVNPGPASSFRVPRAGLWRRALTRIEKAKVVASERREVTLAKRSLSSAASMARTTLNEVARAISALSTRSPRWRASHLSGGVSCGHNLGFGPQHRSRAVSFLTSKFSLPDGTWMCRRNLGLLPRGEEDALARRSTPLAHDLSEAHTHNRDGSLAQSSASGRRDVKLSESVENDLAGRDHGALTDVDRRRADFTSTGEEVASGKHESMGKSRQDSDWEMPDSSFWRRALSIIEQGSDLGQRWSKAVLSSSNRGAGYGSEQLESSDLLFDARQSWTVEVDTTLELGASLDGKVWRIMADLFQALEHRWDDIKLFARAKTLSRLPPLGVLRGKNKKPKHGVVANIFGVPLGDWPSLVHRSRQDA
ncbi:hypothetical protein IE81DRAFT_331427 [Ceraceosorus guamensis]|uniref:Uncharacterized protein n=1 Tax=Ceraceosorus guamensis TaxID=1522189 RepID=A0A316VWD7_9BASI|nr:hypothetical protein IE81DRAFT_331427 [Ceraceosorus guamensis]PWN40753.1 hypothetical protein IE81DRAFT_331427 [Ceraceosorus guamensis]